MERLVGSVNGGGYVHILTVAFTGLETIMDFSTNQLEQMSLRQARELIPHWLCSFMDINAEKRAIAVSQMTAELNQFDDMSLSRSLAYLRTLGDDYVLYLADPLAQKLTRSYMRTLLVGSEISGIENLRSAIKAGPTLLLCNHLAYCDTQVKDLLLADNGAADLASRLVVVAGPKVYGDTFRRMASMGLHTLKTAQSAGLTHNEAGMSAREIASIALGTVRTAHEQMSSGNMVLVYAEGARSRSGRLGSFLKAVRKYLRVAGCQIVPLAISGSQRMMPLGQLKMAPVPVHLRIGAPIKVEDEGPLLAMEAVWQSIAAMLPDEHQPDPNTEAVI